MYDEYRKFYEENVKKYGSQTAIFLMVGAFYELYDLQNTTTGETEFNVRQITDLLGIQLTTKKDSTPDGTVGLFGGFPDYTLHKHAGRLTANGWTVVVVDQIKDAKGVKVLRREISRILSPSTHVEAMAITEIPTFTLLVIQDKQIALASLDLSTATTSTYQCTSDSLLSDDIQQHLSLYKPKELLIYHGKTSVIDESIRRSLPPSIPIHIKPLPSTVSLANADFLRRIYNIKSLLPVREYLSLRSDLEELALLLLLQFAEEHMPSAMKGFQRNQPWIPEQNLICGNHALQQLQMDSVAALFNACITPMGKRNIRERLLKPLTHAQAIQRRLQEIQAFQGWSPADQVALERQLRFIGDLPRLHRKVQLATVTPQEFVALGQSYAAVAAILTFWPSVNADFQPPLSPEDLKKLTTHFAKHITLDKAMQASDDITPYSSNQYPRIKAVEEQIESVLKDFEQVRSLLCRAGSLSSEAIRLEEREKEPFGLKASTATLRALQSVITLLPKGTQIHALKSGGWIDVPELHALNNRLLKLRGQLHIAAKETVLEACAALYEDHEFWIELEEWLSHLDCIRCIAKVSTDRGWTCPTIDATGGGAYLDVRGLRHPLVQGRVAYVQHDVQLGLGTDSWLVYGMNASGKSTLMKAVGIATVLAQAGCFVPATAMTIRPFSSIYTRILNQDNLGLGLSSFAVEMSELRDILRRADDQTLVLGDELCSGTESVSAMALVSAGIQWLAKRKAKFIFATHLHDLPTLLDADALRLNVWHLHVEYDPVSHKLVYDRTLLPGSGSTLYGLEVARAMDLPTEFLENAIEQRHRLLQSVRHTEAKPSSYNSLIRRHLCELCGSATTSELEVHHIQQQAIAKNGILPNGVPMNDPTNLVVLCARCHDEHHAGNLIITPLVQTSTGPERSETASVRTAKTKASKWNEEEISQIQQMLQKYKTATLKAVSYQLKEKHDIEISVQALGALRRSM